MTGTTSPGRSPTTAASPWRRIAAYFVDYFVFIAPLLGVLSIGSRRTPYDWAAGTIVVKRPSTLAGTGV